MPIVIDQATIRIIMARTIPEKYFRELTKFGTVHTVLLITFLMTLSSFPPVHFSRSDLPTLAAFSYRRQ